MEVKEKMRNGREGKKEKREVKEKMRNGSEGKEHGMESKGRKGKKRKE